MNVTFVKSAERPHDLPPERLPEVGFFGRSNVGKSSLINSLTGTKSLARKSRTPGRTRLANYFSVNESLLLVDLPGYGFAKIDDAERQKWQTLIDAFVIRRSVQAMVFVFDPRRELEPLDRSVLAYLPKTAPLIVALTKSDKATHQEIKACKDSLKKTAEKLGHVDPTIFEVSNLKGTGIDSLRKYLFPQK